MNLRLVKVTSEDKEVLWHLLQFLLYEISSNMDLNSKGEYDYKYFDLYFTDDEKRDAYFVYYEQQIVGFVMINDVTKSIKRGKSIAEFFIIPKYRRLGFGTYVAKKIFDMYDVVEVSPVKDNVVADLFWKRVITSYTAGEYEYNNNCYSFLGGQNELSN